MEMSILDAAYNVGQDYKDGGAAGLARRMGENPSHFSSQLAQTGSAKLGLATALKMSVMTGDLRILQVFAQECGQMLVPLPEIQSLSTEDCLQRLGSASIEFAHVAATCCESLADDDVNANELARFRKAKGVLQNAMHQLDVAMAAKHEASKPASERSGGAA
ncbi:hypothetical protein GT347_15995 [Xylophilus rhododendri]|uniref:Uncharacterized protein n=1 Tax=Xylophilus rhododendri TaxID=2697032 RepID=A0A857J6A5_9BURK|nr:phage regulatory CII family protein [Xylophilus rhododendri]QHI99346.1 hypothetical protein GT347_15995 [Xylophilus rhododendri]